MRYVNCEPLELPSLALLKAEGPAPPVCLRSEAAVTAKTCVCQFCREPLEPVQELRYLVETQFLEEPEALRRLRLLPDVDGKPLRVCKACQRSIEADPVGFRTAVDKAHWRPGKASGGSAPGCSPPSACCRSAGCSRL